MACKSDMKWLHVITGVIKSAWKSPCWQSWVWTLLPPTSCHLLGSCWERMRACQLLYMQRLIEKHVVQIIQGLTAGVLSDFLRKKGKLSLTSDNRNLHLLLLDVFHAEVLAAMTEFVNFVNWGTFWGAAESMTFIFVLNWSEVSIELVSH